SSTRRKNSLNDTRRAISARHIESTGKKTTGISGGHCKAARPLSCHRRPQPASSLYNCALSAKHTPLNRTFRFIKVNAVSAPSINTTDSHTPDQSTFQGLILALQQFWAEQGCVILQPLDMEVGAGTFHPAAFLRSLGPETWNAAYVQPSRRPTDGRYGENPNRLQHYYQFQVVMKPSPDNIQELYLESLKRLGFDPLVNDIRFVEDNWESPTLGAWGLGWEVW